MLIQPRDYQITVHNATWNYVLHATGNGIVAMPTGTGKSVNIAMFCYAALRYQPYTRIQVLTHVQELIQQDYDRLKEAWPEAPVGIYSAGLKQKELGYPITMGGIASIFNAVDEVGHVDFLVIDECHLLSNNSDTRYLQYIEKLREKNPYLRVIGYTATPYRMGQGLLTSPTGDGQRPIFNDFIVDLTGMEWFNWFIAEGYLSTLFSARTSVAFDTSGVGTSNGDFTQKALIEKLDGQEIEHEKAVRELMARGQDRSKWLVFTAGIDRAEWVSDRVNSFGIPAAFVHSNIDPIDRKKRIGAYRAREIRCMVGNNIFTTGFDDPEIDLIGMFRPTKSTGLWVQMLGRGTRPLYAPGLPRNTREERHIAMQAGGKRSCLVLDFARNTITLGPVNDPKIPKTKGLGSGEMPTKICGACGAYNHLSAKFCANPECGAEFPPGQLLTESAFTGEIIRTEEEVIEWFNVSTVIYRVHQKGTGKPCVRVTYQCGFRSFDEWVFIEHDGKIGKDARDWWRTRTGLVDPPPTAALLVEYKHLLKFPRQIQVHVNHKPYPEVLHYEY